MTLEEYRELLCDRVVELFQRIDELEQERDSYEYGSDNYNEARISIHKSLGKCYAYQQVITDLVGIKEFEKEGKEK